MQTASNPDQALDLLRATSKQLFRSDLVAIVGSGWSCGKGLPSMDRLARLCAEKVPLSESFGELDDHGLADWANFEENLSVHNDFEVSMNVVSDESTLLRIIEDVIASVVLEAEAPAIRSIVNSASGYTDLTRYISYLARVENPISIVTTNYDRLVEYSARMAGHHVDSLFSGEPLGRLDSAASRSEQRVLTSIRGRRRAVDRPYVEVLKPHGSLDWRELEDGTVVRSDAEIGIRRRIVSPGASKLSKGYQPLFDTHRNAANQRVKSATGFLFVGYGFGDSHLQTYLEDRLAEGVPGLLLTKELTSNAKRFLDTYVGLQAISENPRSGASCWTSQGTEVELPIKDLWSLDGYLREIHHQ